MPIAFSERAHNFLSWNVTETTTPTAPGASLAGTGSASFTFMFGEHNKPIDYTTNSPIDDIEFIQGDEALVELSILGTPTYLPGHIDNATFVGSEGMQTSASFDLVSMMNMLSVVRDVPPVVEKYLDEIFSIYIGTVHPGAPINYEGSDSNLYSFIGWTGDVWQGLCSLAAMTGMEITFDGFEFIIRDIGQNVVDFGNRTAPTQQFRSNNLGRYIDVTYQNQTVISTILAARENLSPNPSLEADDTGWIGGIISHPDVTTNMGRSTLWSANGTYSYMVEYDCDDHVATTETARIFGPVIPVTPGKPVYVSVVANMFTDKPDRFTPTGNYTLRVRGFDALDNQVGPDVTETYHLGTRGGFSHTFPGSVTQIQADVSKDWTWTN